MNPILYIIGTPIGNPEDFAPHSLTILQCAGLIIGEEFKTTSTFLKKHGITKDFELCNEHTSITDLQILSEKIQKNEISCLFSDGGMPLLEDPGHDLVKMCITKKIEIRVSPGFSAFLVALILSGFPTTPFTFCGFLPREPSERKKVFKKYLSLGHTLVFYETPYRYKKAFYEILEDIPRNTPVFLGIDLTSDTEFKFWGDAGRLRELIPGLSKGNPVLVLASRNL